MTAAAAVTSHVMSVPATAASPSSLSPDSLKLAPIPRKSVNVKTDKPRPHVCPVCTRAFARLEHLRRHERSHTNEKPFQCALCGRCFARRDLVLRHQLKLHLVDNMKPEHVLVLENNTSSNPALPHREPCSPSSSGEVNSDNASQEELEKSLEKFPMMSSSKPGVYAQPNIAPGSMFYGHPGPFMANSTTTSRRHNSVSLPLTQSNPSLNVFSQVLSPIVSSDCLALANGPLQVVKLESKMPTPSQDDLCPDEGPVFNFGSSLPPHMRMNRSQLQSSASPTPMLSRYTTTEDSMGNTPSPRQAQSAPFATQVGTSNFDPPLSTFSREFSPLVPSAIDVEDPNLKELLGDIDLETLSMVDWGNIENLDIDSILHTGGPNDNTLGVSPNLLTRKQQSLKNLQQYFTGSDSGNTAAALQMSLKQKSLKNLQQFFVDHYPDHKSGKARHKGRVQEVASSSSNLNNSSGNYGSLMTPLRQATPFTIGDGHDELKPRHLPHSNKATGATFRSAPEGQPYADSSKRVKLSSSDCLSRPSLDNAEKWLQDIVLAPLDHNFPAPSHYVGFLDPHLQNEPHLSDNEPHYPGNSAHSFRTCPEEISSLFRSRQIDLIKGKSSTNLRVLANTEQSTHHDSLEAVFEPSSLSSGNFNYVSENLRHHIIYLSNLNDQGFPPCQDLNNYMRLYELELNKYFPFVHLPSLKVPRPNNTENISLLLAMTAIGALFSCHSSNAYLLFNLSKLQIQRLFEKEMLMSSLPAAVRKVPLLAHQCLVLHIYVSLFINEPDMAEITGRKIASMIGLVKSTKFNEPLESLLQPPPSCLQYVGKPFASLDPQVQKLVQQNFEYFTIAQSRIRTLHVFYMLLSFRASLMGLSVLFDNTELKSGTSCFQESLWQSDTAQIWFSRLPLFAASWSLERLSNGEPFVSLCQNLHLKNDFKVRFPHLPFSSMLPMLMYIHEQVQVRLDAMPEPFNVVLWKLHHTPHLTDLIKTWEVIFVRMNGSLWIDSNNRHVLTSNDDLKLVLPLYWFLRIKLSININPVMGAVMRKDWRAMNFHLERLKALEAGHKVCQEGMPYCLDIFKLWVYNIETIMYDLSETALRTPVFFLTCMCAATLVFSVYMELLEQVARGPGDFEYAQVISWIDCCDVILMLEQSLSPLLKTLYLDFLARESKGQAPYAEEGATRPQHNMRDLLEEKEQLNAYLGLPSSGVGSKLGKHQQERQKAVSLLIKAEVCNARLSAKSLHLGIRVLADAPVWPVAMGLAEALQHRAALLLRPPGKQI